MNLKGFSIADSMRPISQQKPLAFPVSFKKNKEEITKLKELLLLTCIAFFRQKLNQNEHSGHNE